ncbi:FadR/GntR family transcriptional regulator [Arthrobacter sp. JSM 101049]|uniref:FadR/GntR family transcriptional regulator n=1 Tax=Arthrobacter sp. JSM 101049 TaxID=929097 RepID=UPI003562E759
MTTTPRTPLAQEVTAALRTAIAFGEWPIGERIPAEPALAERFAVSRGTLREAIKALSHAGMLEVRRGDGTYVRASSEMQGTVQQAYARHTDQDVLQVRFALDAQAARLASTSATVADLDVMRGHLAGRRRAWEAQDIEAWIAADWAFHLAVARASGNGLLVELYASFGDVFHGTKMAQRLRGGFDGCRAAGHEELVEAVAVGDGDAAARSTTANLTYCLGFASG